MPIEKESWYVYAKDKGISKEKAQEYWDIAKENVDKKQDDFTQEDWEKVMGVYKKIIDNSLKEKETKKDEVDITPFISYATKAGVEEDQATAVFYSVRGKVSKDEKQEPTKFGPEQMGLLWGEYKDAIQDITNKEKDSKKKITKSCIVEGFIIKENTIIYEDN